MLGYEALSVSLPLAQQAYFVQMNFSTFCPGQWHLHEGNTQYQATKIESIMNDASVVQYLNMHTHVMYMLDLNCHKMACVKQWRRHLRRRHAAMIELSDTDAHMDASHLEQNMATHRSRTMSVTTIHFDGV